MDKNDIVWFSENWAHKLTRLDPRPGQFTQMPVEARSPVNSAGFGNFAVAPDGDIWAAEGGTVVSGGNIHPASRGLEALTRRIVREEPGGAITVLASSFLRHKPDCGMLEVVPARWLRQGTAGTRTMAGVK